ncbi:SRPBCC family protein [Mucilaginibacter psychrotolerans]|uniref:Polyketide cyclase n=1 Tax=Mucilaginibacter psychrotolerans TaxID=1524096 RepID=A0A4Y8SBH9_9SPHI|nr:SRPBCC family protein [Mucilaginibacter psychrotolerans]TFF36328.1 polyketide cyclase [Mucilaginibacter psychrotolerans]
MANPTQITVEATVNAPVEIVWSLWTDPEHVVNWNAASDDWHTPKASNDLQVGGKFTSTMAAKDGSMSFDFEGVYSVVDEYKLIAYEIGDGRKVSVTFTDEDEVTKIVETFEAEGMNPVEMQRSGWQAILNNFKKYAEEN